MLEYNIKLAHLTRLVPSLAEKDPMIDQSSQMFYVQVQPAVILIDIQLSFYVVFLKGDSHRFCLSFLYVWQPINEVLTYMHIEAKTAQCSFMFIGGQDHHKIAREMSELEEKRQREKCQNQQGLSRPHTITQVAKTLFAPKVPFIFLKEQFRSFLLLYRMFLPPFF